MEYLIDLKFNDTNIGIIVNMVTVFKVNTQEEADQFVAELVAGFKRRNVFVFPPSYYRIDVDEELKNRNIERFNYHKSKANASICIEQFIIESPDQSKSLIDNLVERFFNGEESIAKIGEKYNIPVFVKDKASGNPINGEIYYFGIEQLIEK